MRLQLTSVLILLFVLSAMPAGADEPSPAPGKTSLPRFGVWAGAGSGLLVARDTAVPARLNLGAELLLTKKGHIGVGYQGVFPVSNDLASVPGGTGTPMRMVHLFPHIRCFLFPRDFGERRLSVNLSPGIAVQSTSGMMMSGGTSSGGSSPSFAAHASTEYHIPIEERVDLGVQAAYDYLGSTRGTNALPRVQIFSGSMNLHYYFGQAD